MMKCAWRGGRIQKPSLPGQGEFSSAVIRKLTVVVYLNDAKVFEGARKPEVLQRTQLLAANKQLGIGLRLDNKHCHAQPSCHIEGEFIIMAN